MSIRNRREVILLFSAGYTHILGTVTACAVLPRIPVEFGTAITVAKKCVYIYLLYF